MHRVAATAVAATLLLPAGCRHDEAADAFGGNPHHGAAVIAQAGCGTCHTVPGIPGAHGRVGPALDHIATQTILVGTLPNTPDNMLTWIRTPQAVRPGDAMPNMELTEHDARDVAAYLSTLR
jgi:cytochrome c2